MLHAFLWHFFCLRFIFIFFWFISKLDLFVFSLVGCFAIVFRGFILFIDVIAVIAFLCAIYAVLTMFISVLVVRLALVFVCKIIILNVFAIIFITHVFIFIVVYAVTFISMFRKNCLFLPILWPNFLRYSYSFYTSSIFVTVPFNTAFAAYFFIYLPFSVV
jgi:hypothetical protein